MLPTARNIYFTGRDSILARLHDELLDGGRVALSGLGGVGKTQLAIEYAYRYSDDYTRVLWISAVDPPALTASFGQIAKYLDLPEQHAEDQTAALRAVLRWMETRDRWLAIYDNADEPDQLKDFLPRVRTGHLLVTSRAQVFDVLGIAKVLEIPEMLPGEALTFLLRRTRRDDADDPAERLAAKALCEELGYLPLALEQAGAYIAGKQARFEGYLHSYRRQKLAVLERARPSFGKTTTSVATTWTIAFESLASARAAADVLRLSSVLNPDNIPLELLQRGANMLGPEISRALFDPDDELLVDELLEPLTHYSLIRRHVTSRTYSLHRLVQEVTKERMDADERRCWSERAVRALAAAFPAADFVDWPLAERLLTNVQAAVNMLEDGDIDASLDAAKLFTNAGRYLFRRGRYARAEPLQIRALAIRERQYGSDHPDVAASLNNLANVYFGQGRYEESQSLHEQALAIRERVLGPAHLDVAQSLNNVANVYYVRGNFTQAEALHRRAIAIKEDQLDPSDPDIALSLDNLGNIYYDEHNYAEAERLHKRALEIREKALGPDHPFVADSLDNLANVYRSRGKYAQAEPLHRRAVAIHELALGPDHHHVAESLVNLASVYRHQGKYAQAEPICQRALTIYEKTLGTEHPDSARSVNELACLYRAEGREGEAERLHRRALAIVERALGPDHPAALEIRGTFARSTPRRQSRARDLLTPREREVAGLVATGRSNRAIADSLSLSERTVETHVASILAKFHVSSRGEVAAYMAKQGTSATG